MHFPIKTNQLNVLAECRGVAQWGRQVNTLSLLLQGAGVGETLNLEMARKKNIEAEI